MKLGTAEFRVVLFGVQSCDRFGFSLFLGQVIVVYIRIFLFFGAVFTDDLFPLILDDRMFVTNAEEVGGINFACFEYLVEV